MPREILIVEDNQDMLDSFKKFLGEEGATVTAVASNGVVHIIDGVLLP